MAYNRHLLATKWRRPQWETGDMNRCDVDAWLLARHLFRNETADRFWSNGIHAQHLVACGESIATDDEKAFYYDRAFALLSAQSGAKAVPPR